MTRLDLDCIIEFAKVFVGRGIEIAGTKQGTTACLNVGGLNAPSLA